jgi:peptide/nickel transport system substrate-binding protein/oligopeptide transport system substrate-binding protein
LRREVRRIVLHLLAAVLLFYVSCAPSDRAEGYLYLRLSTNPTTLDPALIVDVQGATIAAKLFNGLVRLQDSLEVAPDIAERWEISGDGMRYRFFLRPGVTFENGREVHARDVKYSFERVLDPNTRSPNTWLFDRVEGASAFRQGIAADVAGFRVLGDYVFEVRLKRAFSPFLRILTMSAAYIVPREEVERYRADFSSNPRGTGPFVLKEWLPHQRIVLDSRRGYFGESARVAGIVYRIVPEDLTAISEFELGNLDILSLPASSYAKFRDDDVWRSRLRASEGLNTYYLGLNASKPPFSSRDLRRAVASAIDREKILKTFYEGRGRLAQGPVPDLLRTWAVVGESRDALRYDPSAARSAVGRLMPKGVEAKMYVSADQEVVDLAEIIQASLLKIGMNVRIVQLEWSAFKEALNRGEPDMFWLSWWADYPDAENILFPLFHSSNLGPAGNRTWYVNKEVDALIEEGQHAADESVRDAAYRGAEEAVVSDVPWVPFWHKTEYFIVQPALGGFRTYPIYTMDKGTELYFR